MKKLLPILCTTVIVSLSGCTNTSIDASNTNTALDTTMSVSNSVISSSEIDLTSSSTTSIEGSPVMEFFVGHTEKYSLNLPADINWQIPSPDVGYTYAFDADNQYKGSVSVKTSYSVDFDSDINDIIAFTGNVDVDTVVVNKSTNVTIAGINTTIKRIIKRSLRPNVATILWSTTIMYSFPALLLMTMQHKTNSTK